MEEAPSDRVSASGKSVWLAAITALVVLTGAYVCLFHDGQERQKTNVGHFVATQRESDPAPDPAQSARHCPAVRRGAGETSKVSAVADANAQLRVDALTQSTLPEVGGPTHERADEILLATIRGEAPRPSIANEFATELLTAYGPCSDSRVDSKGWLEFSLETPSSSFDHVTVRRLITREKSGETRTDYSIIATYHPSRSIAPYVGEAGSSFQYSVAANASGVGIMSGIVLWGTPAVSEESTSYFAQFASSRIGAACIVEPGRINANFIEYVIEKNEHQRPIACTQRLVPTVLDEVFNPAEYSQIISAFQSACEAATSASVSKDKEKKG